MTSIDERIVSMKFDNKQFEEGIKTTLESLQKLKERLSFKGIFKGVDSINKAVNNFDMSSMEQSIDAVQVKFSALQVVGMTTIANLTNTVVNGAKKIFSNMTGAIIQGGINRAMNLEQAKFQLEGLGVAWEDIKGDIDYAVQDTAYGLDVAARAASQLSASGVMVGDNMKSALRGISGVAAMTGSSYEDIATIFTTVAGNGRLMASELNRIGARGINAAAALGKYLGVSEQEVREMTSRGEIDFQTFANAMDSTFGEHAKEANKTFTGALANMKAALARIGADVASRSLVNLRDIFNSIRVVINNVHKSMQPFLDGLNAIQDAASAFFVSFTDLGGLEALIKSIGNIFYGVYSILKPIKDAFVEAFPSILPERLADIAKAIQDFTSRLRLSEDIADKLRRTFAGIFAVLESVLSIIFKIGKVVVKTVYTGISTVLKVVLNVVLTITAAIGDAIVMVKGWINAFLDLSIVKGIIDSLRNLFNGFLFAINKVGEGLRVAFNLLSSNVFGTLYKVFDSLGNGIFSAVKRINDFIEVARQAVHEELIKQETVDRITRIKNAFVVLRDAILGVFRSVRDKLIYVFRSLKESIIQLYNWVRNLFKEYINFPTAQEAFQRVLEFFAKAAEMAANVAKSGIKIFGEFLNKVREISGVSFSKFISNVAELRDAIFSAVDINGKIDAVKGFIGQFANGAARIMTDTKNVLSEVKKYLLDFVGFVQQKFSGINLGSVVAAGLGASLMAFLYKVTKLLPDIAGLSKSIQKVFYSITDVLKNFSNVLNEISNAIKAKVFAEKADAISGIIKSIVLLALSLAVLSMMDQQKLLSSAIILGVLSGVLIGLVGALNYLASKTKPSEVVKSTISITSVVGSILFLAIALRILEGLDFGQILSAIISMGLVMLELGLLLKAMNKMTGLKDTKVITSIGLSVLLLSLSMKTLSGLDPSGIAKALGVMAGLLIFIGLLNLTSKQAKPEAMGSLWKFLAALALLTLAFKILSGIPADKMLVSLHILQWVILDIMALMLATKKAGPFAEQAGKSILQISAGLIAISLALHILSVLDPDKLSTAIIALAGITAAIGVMIWSTSKAGLNSDKPAKSLIAASAGILLISVAMALLAQLDPGGLLGATLAVSAIIGMFAVLIMATEKSKDANKAIKTVTIAMMAMSGLLAVMSLIDPVNSMSAATAISMVCGMLALIMQQTIVMGKHAKVAYTPLLVCVLVIGVISGMLYLLAQLPVENVLGTALGLSSVLLAMVGAFSVFGIMAQFMNPATLGMIVATAAIFDAVVVVVGALFVGLGALVTYCEEVSTWLDAGIVVVEKIGNGIGAFFGGIVAGFQQAASASLPEIGSNLTAFMTNVQGFLEGSKQFTPESTAGLDSLTEFIRSAQGLAQNNADFGSLITGLPMLGASVKLFSTSLNGIDNFDNMVKAADTGKTVAEAFSIMGEVKLGGLKIGVFSEQMTAFGEALVAYNNSVSGITDYSAVNNSVSAAKSLAEVANSIPAQGGLLQNISGAQDLKDFGEKAKAFGESLVGYSGVVSAEGAINTEAINTSVSAAKSLIDLANSLPSMNGALQWLTGGTVSFDMFGTQLESFGASLGRYSSSISGENAIDVNAINTSVAAGTALAELGNALPASNSLWELFAGSDSPQSLSQFGASLPLFGAGLAGFCAAINEAPIDNTKVNAACAAGASLAALAKDLPTADGWVFSIFSSHTQGLDTFGESIEAFGEGLAGFAGKIAGADWSGIENAKTIWEYFYDLAVLLKDDAEINTRLTTFKSTITTLGDGLKSYHNNITGIDWDNMNTSIDFINSIANSASYANMTGSLENAAVAALDSFIKALQDKTDGTVAAVKVIFSAISVQITVSGAIVTTMFTNTGEAFVEAFNNGIGNKIEDTKAKAKELFKAVLYELQNHYWDYWTEGYWVARGYSEGMSENAYLAVNAAASMAQAVIDKVKEVQASHSPAKKYIEIARWAVMGMAIGFDKYGDIAVDSAQKTALNSMNTMRTAFKLLEDMDEEMAFRPTIAPVLDLDSVNQGMGQLNSMFAQNFALSIENSKLKAAAAIPIQNGSDSINKSNQDRSQFQNVYNNFVQNNYSPKPLSRAEIYRDSKSLFARAKGVSK